MNPWLLVAAALSGSLAVAIGWLLPAISDRIRYGRQPKP